VNEQEDLPVQRGGRRPGKWEHGSSRQVMVSNYLLPSCESSTRACSYSKTEWQSHLLDITFAPSKTTTKKRRGER